MAAQEISAVLNDTTSLKINQMYENFLTRLSPKARTAMAKYEENCQNRGIDAYSDLWMRLAGLLSQLAPQFADMVGFSVKFYIPDGKYRQQVFALETTQKGSVAIYMPDVTNAAISKNLLSPSSIASSYRMSGKTDNQICLEPITADTCETVVCKAMVSWGKRALVTTLDRNSTAEQISTVEKLCNLAAESWPTSPETTAPKHQTV